MKRLSLLLILVASAAIAGVVGNSIPTLKVEILEVDGVKYRATYRLEKLEIEKPEAPKPVVEPWWHGSYFTNLPIDTRIVWTNYLVLTNGFISNGDARAVIPEP